VFQISIWGGFGAVFGRAKRPPRGDGAARMAQWPGRRKVPTMSQAAYFLQYSTFAPRIWGPNLFLSPGAI